MSAANEFVRSGAAAGTSSLPSGPCEPARLDELLATLGTGGLGQLAAVFVSESSGRMNRLRGATAVSVAAVEREAHQLWGAAASLGATRMTELADAIRFAAGSGDHAAVDRLTDAIEDEIGAVGAALTERARQEDQDATS